MFRIENLIEALWNCFVWIKFALAFMRAIACVQPFASSPWAIRLQQTVGDLRVATNNVWLRRVCPPSTKKAAKHQGYCRRLYHPFSLRALICSYQPTNLGMLAFKSPHFVSRLLASRSELDAHLFLV